MLFESAALIKTQLKHRYVSLRIQVAQDAPRAVIEAPGFIFPDGFIGRDLLGFLGRSGRRIFDFIQGLGKSVEVVNRPWTL